MENRDALIKSALKYGLLIGLVQVVLTLITYLMGVEFMSKWWIGTLILVLAIVFLVVAGKKLRSENGGFISFGNLFILVWIVFCTSFAVGTIFNILLYNVIDPNLAANMVEIIIENTTSMMERFGTPDDAIDDAIANMGNLGEEFTPMGQLKSLLVWVIIGAVISAIVAAILKKNNESLDFGDEEA